MYSFMQVDCLYFLLYPHFHSFPFCLHLFSICSLLEHCRKHKYLSSSGEVFTVLVSSLLENLLDYRTIANDESEENRMSCTVNLLVSKNHWQNMGAHLLLLSLKMQKSSIHSKVAFQLKEVTGGLRYGWFIVSVSCKISLPYVPALFMKFGAFAYIFGCSHSCCIVNDWK